MLPSATCLRCLHVGQVCRWCYLWCRARIYPCVNSCHMREAY
jgi:hypothetical protein